MFLNGKQTENYDAVTRTYDYRFRFQFLLSSVDDKELLKNGNSAMPVSKSQDIFLPLEKFVLANPDKDIRKIMNEVAYEYNANGIDIVKLTSSRTNNYYRMFEFYLPQGLNF